MDESQIKKSIKEYIETDDLITEKNKEMSILRKKKKECEKSITDYMTLKDIKEISTGKGTLKLKKVEKSKPVNQDYITEKLGEKISDREQISLLADHIFSTVEKVESQVLKRNK